MNRTDKPPATRAPSAGQAATGPPMISSQELLANGREVIIRHGNESYRLQLTRTNRLILTK